MELDWIELFSCKAINTKKRVPASAIYVTAIMRSIYLEWQGKVYGAGILLLFDVPSTQHEDIVDAVFDFPFSNLYIDCNSQWHGVVHNWIYYRP